MNKFASRMVRFATMAIGLCVAPYAALAHHSAAMFDREKVVTLTGVVKDYAYTQPHSWIDLYADDPSGTPVEWGVECGTPPAMRNLGITPSVLKAGDKISIRVHPVKDGRHTGSFIDITLANGEVRGMARGPSTQAPVYIPSAPPGG